MGTCSFEHVPILSCMVCTSLLVVQATIVNCSIEQQQILAILISVKNIVHILQIFFDSLVYHRLTIVFRSNCSIQHFCTESLMYIFYTLHLIECQT